MKPTINDCNIIQLPKISERKGAITPIYSGEHVPFQIERVFYLYDVPGGSERGGHAHKNLEQLIIAASGCFDVMIDDGNNKKVVELNRPYFALHVKPGIWREIFNFSSGAICLVLASEKYDPEDYIRDYSTFLRYKDECRKGQ